MEYLILTDKEMAEAIHVKPRTLRRYARNGVVPSIKLGGRRVYRRESVIEALTALEQGQSTVA